MSWISMQWVGNCFSIQFPFLAELVPLWPHIASNLTIAIAGYVTAVALLTATQLRRGQSASGLLWLGAAGSGAIATLHLFEALSLRFALGGALRTTEGVAAFLLLGTAIALSYRLPKILTKAADGISSQDKQLAVQTDTQATGVSAIAPQPLEQQVVTCNQQLEKVQLTQSSLLQQEKSIRGELETALTNLQDTAERLNIALSAASMGSWEWDLETQQQDWSPQAKAILDFAPEQIDLTYSDWAQRVDPDDLPKVEAALAEAQANRSSFSAEYRIRIPGQKVRWVLSQGRFVFSIEGKPRRMIGIIQETTQDKQASLALKASEARFRAVFEQAAVGVTRLSPAGNWLQVNDTFCQLLGYEADEIIGKHYSEVSDPGDRSQDEHYYQQLVSGQVESCRLEKRYLHRDGTPIWVMATVSTERGDNDELVAFIAVIEDIRTLKQTRLELEKRAAELEQVNSLLAITNAMLEKRNAELDQFAYVASHDLKAPLRAIANLSEWIEEDLGNQLPEENQHQLSLLRNRVHRMEALINGLLEYSRVGRREKQIEAVDVLHLIEEAIDFISPPPSFTFVLPDEAPTIRTNRTALNQVFTNLIGNAIKHHDRDDGRIEITAKDQGTFVAFAVIDDGPGISPEYHEKVFTIFQTLKSRDELESTGIGLSLVKKIIESEGGTISLKSDVGEGATFHFTWPKSS